MRSKNVKTPVKVLHKYPLMIVEWRDAQSDAAWGDIEEIDKWADETYLVSEVGWLISKNKEHIVMTSEIGNDGSIGNRTKIPNSWIVSRRAIK